MNQRNVTTKLSLTIVMTSLVAVNTLIVRIPNPMGGYFNLGDVMIFISALTFGPLVGGLAGGIGSAIADIIGFPLFAVPTLIIKGLEGFIAGSLTNKKQIYRDILAVFFAGSGMVFGYFIFEWLILQWGFAAALAEVPANVGQIIIGGIIGIPIAHLLRRRFPKNQNQ